MEVRRLAPLVALALCAATPAMAHADPGDEIGTAIAQVNVCHRTASEANAWVLVPVDIHDLPARVAGADIPFVASVYECFQQAPRSLFLVLQDQDTTAKAPPVSDPSSQDQAVPDKDIMRRAVPVEVAPLELLPTGGGQGQVADEDTWRDARPVSTELLPDAATGGGQGQVPDESTWRDGRPVSAELLTEADAPEQVAEAPAENQNPYR